MGVAGPTRKQQPKQKKKGQRVSGNPAKRNAPAQVATAPLDPAAAFRSDQLDPAALEQAMGDFQLPPQLRDMLGKQGGASQPGAKQPGGLDQRGS